MEKIRKILQCYLLHRLQSVRQIAAAAGCSKSAVNRCLQRMQKGQAIEWAQIEPLDDVGLEALLGLGPEKGSSGRPLPDWARVDQEIRRRDCDVTLKLIWEEYRAEHKEGYSYTQFWKHFSTWKKKQSLVMRQEHKAGEKGFVDFCDGMLLTDGKTGELTKTQLFVGTLGASSYSFALAVASQSIPHFIECHQQMFNAFGGVPAIIVPDNLKSGVKRPDRYEAEINPTYAEMAEHYGTVIIPARVRKPRDKAKVEVAVQVAQRWVLAALRNRVFYSLSDMNVAIAELMERMNGKVMRHRKQSRRALWETIDRPALQPLPARRYEMGEWKKVRLNIDYHFEFSEHFYSASSSLAGEELMVRATANTIEVFHKRQRVASHARSYHRHKMTTNQEHMPSSHRRYAEWTPSRMTQWAHSIAPEVGSYVSELLKRRSHPEQGFRSVLGLIGLVPKHGNERLVKAVRRATELGLYSFTGVRSMLEKQMESAPMPCILGANGKKEAEEARQIDLLAAENIRGSDYYQ